jgi:hypothetical protein
MLGINQRSDEVKTSYKICRCKFRFDGSMQTGIKLGLQMVRIVLMYDNYKYSVKGTESRETQVCNYS